MINDSGHILHIIVIEDESGRRTLSLEDVKYTMGRKYDNHIVLHSKQASRHHATLVKKGTDREGFSYWIVDGDLEGNKSHNGLYINGTKCSVHELKHGDLINFGCEINASYHQIVPLQDPENPISNDTSGDTLTRREDELFPTDYPDKSTLIIERENGVSFTETIADRGYLDSLTDLPNRHLFNEHLFIALKNAVQGQQLLGVLFIDIEQFKEINNKWDYHIGDTLLRAIGLRLKESTRSGDIVARWGGDEFMILLPQMNEEGDLEKIVERISRTLLPPYEIENRSLAVPITIASVLYPRDGQESQTLLRQLESQVKQIKGTRREGREIERAESENKTGRSLKLEYFLQKGIENNELSLYYQPQVNIRRGEVEGLEVLLRWKHPQYGPISPARFLPLLEETDSIFLLSRWVLQNACQQAICWRTNELLSTPISINVSPRQLHDPRFPEMVARVLSDTGLRANCLEIEMTETNFLVNRAETYRIIHELEQIGVGLSLDDFGIGQASIGYLGELPIQKLKIAQDLIKHIAKTRQNRSFVSAALALGKCFNQIVVAEGVETQQQLEILKGLGCERVQGHLISSPLPAPEIARFLAAHLGLSGKI
ncbi:EAL domain-containing protein [Pannus brasiliensis CCIBt3594]|uniref:EAL domain-containing protein n=1 Tax=Pannus brasiliensis CCIBt3594 TaxID=1427578 RepID=A0AAW9QX91_9CHRO